MAEKSKRLSSEKVRELLNAVKPYYVCPVTGTKIPADDTKAIEAHKDKVLAEIAASEQEAVKKEKMKITLSMVKKSITEADLLSKVADQLRIWFEANEVPKAKFKNLRVSVVNFDGGVHMTTPYVVIHGVDKCSTLLKKVLGENYAGMHPLPAENRRDYVAILSSRSFLGKALASYYAARRTKWGKKLSDKQRLQLRENNPEYAAGVSRLQEIQKQIHDLHIEHASITADLTLIRVKELGGGDFEFN